MPLLLSVFPPDTFSSLFPDILRPPNVVLFSYIRGFCLLSVFTGAVHKSAGFSFPFTLLKQKDKCLQNENLSHSMVLSANGSNAAFPSLNVIQTDHIGLITDYQSSNHFRSTSPSPMDNSPTRQQVGMRLLRFFNCSYRNTVKSHCSLSCLHTSRRSPRGSFSVSDNRHISSQNGGKAPQAHSKLSQKHQT